MCKELTPWERVVEFHGHVCPGIAIGYRVAVIALNTLGKSYPLSDEGLCITDRQFCGLDALQLLVGVTYGKGNLVIDAKLEHEFVLCYHRKGEAYSIQVNPQAYALIEEWQNLFEQQRDPEATKARKNELTMQIVALTQQVMDLEDQEFCVCKSLDYQAIMQQQSC